MANEHKRPHNSRSSPLPSNRVNNLTHVPPNLDLNLTSLIVSYHISAGLVVNSHIPSLAHCSIVASVPKDNPRQSLQERLNRHKLEMLPSKDETDVQYDP